MPLPSLTSHGVVVVQPWALLSNPADNYKAEWVMEVLAWVRDNLEDKLHATGLDPGLQLDMDQVHNHGEGPNFSVIVKSPRSPV